MSDRMMQICTYVLLTYFEGFQVLDQLLGGKDERSEGDTGKYDFSLPLRLTHTLNTLQLQTQEEVEHK